jgi:hypothetical protein
VFVPPRTSLRAASVVGGVLVLGAGLFGAMAQARRGQAARTAGGVNWTGTMTSVGSLPVPNNPCHDAFNTKIALTVAADGKVTGTGDAVATTPTTCAIQPTTVPPVTAATLSIQGAYASETFSVQLSPVTISPNPGLDGGFFANWCCPAPTQVLPAKNGEVHTTVTVTDTSRDKAGTSVNIWDLKRSCDPELLSKALREYATGDSFAKAASGELRKASAEVSDFGKEYAKESGEVGAEKGSLLQGLELVDHALEVTPLAAYADLAQGLEIAGIYGGLIIAVEEVYTKLLPTFREHSKLVDEASADMKRAETWWKRGNADLKQALAQGPCVDPKLEQELNRLLNEQKLKDRARALIDSWQTNGNGSLYINPATGEILDEGAALKAAAAILKQARSIQTVADDRSKIQALEKRLRAALGQVNRAIADHKKVNRRINRFQTSTKNLLRRLKPLLKS